MPFVVLLFASILIQLVIAGGTGPGGPGLASIPDKYNKGWWNKTYSPIAPQQVHLSWLSDGTAARLQFATTEKVDRVQLIYWPLYHNNETTLLEEPEQAGPFIDPGPAKRIQYLYNFRTKDLAPSTRFQYKVGAFKDDISLWSDIYEFHTPDSTDNFQFIAAADMGIVNAVSMPILKQLARQNEYDFLAMMGDQAYDLADMDGTKGDEYLNFAQEVYAQMPVLTTPGNHEKHYNFTHYKRRFNHLPFNESDSPTPMLYSFDYKSMHLVSFSTEAYFSNDTNELQTALQWLEQDLKRANAMRHKRPWLVIMGHRPLYCTPRNDKDCSWKADLLRHGLLSADNTTRTTLGMEELFIKYKVDLYLCGHKHGYERSFPIAGNKKMADQYHNTPSYFQVITGNAGNYDGPDPADITTLREEWSAKFYPGYGLTFVSVSPTGLNVSHWESRIDGKRGVQIDNVVVTKDLML
ncbi:iron zinc purple acid phosphatase-like [Lichtheimia corymbifera JMRC:FSU:9682]|uniref:Purple acid phosphatase n=1 Tax=Lichtheimia corymbifera JMRC:FSU:9682 TaxID=1263082 RepID=A0A068REN9_9FUNG|nr:iron zinc purple acid phosphatase-like [Lichtheimia corymbifera JMRC:FSU:9682]